MEAMLQDNETELDHDPVDYFYPGDSEEEEEPEFFVLPTKNGTKSENSRLPNE